MDRQPKKMKYPKHFKKYRAPQINLPFPSRIRPLIFEFFDILTQDTGPKKTTSCKICHQIFEIILGSTSTSSYTFEMTYHLDKHPEQHRFYLSKLAEILEPDTRSLYEHFLVLDSNRSEEESSRRLDESIRNRTLNRELINSAGDSYRRRDSAFLKK